LRDEFELALGEAMTALHCQLRNFAWQRAKLVVVEEE
jgi:hypothetical protein